MIELLSWVSLSLVIGQLWLVGSKMYQASWWVCIAACIAWGWFSFATGAWALLVQQFIIMALAVRGLKKLDEESS